MYERVQQLFTSEGAKLPGLHLVFSVSPYMLEQNKQLPTVLGTGGVVSMPSVHVFQRNSSLADAQGVAAVVQLVERRFPGWGQVFTVDQLQRLILATGGDLRELLRAIRVAINEDIEALPVKDEVVSQALDSVRPPKAIPAEHVAWMARLQATHEPELSDKIDARVLQRYLSTKHVLAYLNGEAWYAVHPLLRDWVVSKAARAAVDTVAAMGVAGPALGEPARS